MSRQYHHLRAIILKKKPWNESDYNVTLYTEYLGKIEVIAKGARKMTSHFSGHLETLNVGAFQIYESPKRFTLTQCQTEKNFKNIRECLPNAILALAIVEIVEKSTSREDTNQIVFKLMEKTLEILNENRASILTIESFKFRLMHMLGVLPEITHCSFCHQRWQIETEIWLDKEGHMACKECKKNTSPAPLAIELKFIKLINFLLQEGVEKTHVVLTKNEEKQLKTISHLFLNNYLSQEIFGEKILDLNFKI